MTEQPVPAAPTARPRPPSAAPAARTLVIVESPAKAKTIQGILGRGYEVTASKGHVRDLPESELGVDVENGFVPTFVVDRDKRDLVQELSRRAKAASDVVLATDLDREGESIAWDLAELLGIDTARADRVAFHEVTPVAITAAFKARRPLNRDLVEAQRARRILDRLVGYEVSPLLWRKVQRGLSAGRVQTVALRLVVERDREIRGFVPQEYWDILADLSATRKPQERFTAKLHSKNGKKITERSIATKEAADALIAELRPAAYSVEDISERTTERRGPAPFTTSSLQQAALNKLGMNAKRAMQVAQELYEGVAIGGQRVGLITYMRTDSVTVAPPAQKEAKELIAATWGAEYAPAKANVHKGKAAKTQEAHECVRPTAVARTPDKIRAYLDSDQARLYALIWKQFMASQMVPARYRVRAVTVRAQVDPKTRYGFRASAARLVFPGWKAAWGITSDEAAQKEKADEEREGVADKDEELQAGRIPVDLVKDEACTLHDLRGDQHFTEPPPHFTEATLTKKLEELGIGRPSTYVPTINRILTVKYVERDGKALRATAVGENACDFLVERFPDHFSTDFTARMEEELDEVAAGKLQRVVLLARFWQPFFQRLGGAREAAPRKLKEPTGRSCPDCGRELVRRWGRFGPFVGCDDYPTCKFIEKAPRTPAVPTGVMCPECGKELVERTNRKKGTKFYGCSGFPACRVIVNEPPLAERCPACNWVLVLRGQEHACPRCAPLPRRSPDRGQRAASDAPPATTVAEAAV